MRMGSPSLLQLRYAQAAGHASALSEVSNAVPAARRTSGGRGSGQTMPGGLYSTADDGGFIDLLLGQAAVIRPDASVIRRRDKYLWRAVTAAVIGDLQRALQEPSEARPDALPPAPSRYTPRHQHALFHTHRYV